MRDYYNSCGIEPDDNDNLDVDVSFDGTWLTRGHCSNIGMGFVIEAETGFVLDYHVFQSSARNVCASMRNTAETNVFVRNK
jgi:hypothetical protein